MLNRLRVLASSIEGTKGEAETLEAADADILVEDPRFNFAPPEIAQDYTRDTLSPTKSIMGERIAQISFRVALKGSGTGATPPALGKLLKACCLKETVQTSSVAYTLDSDDADTDTLTMAVLIGRSSSALIRKLYGARGDGTIEWTSNGLAWLNLTFTGIYDSATVGNQLTPTGFDTTDPEIWKNASLTIASYEPLVVTSFSLALGNAVKVRPSANATNGLLYARITRRDPRITMSIEMEPSSYNPYTKMLGETLEAIGFDLGASAGNTWSFAAPKLQITGVSDDDEEDMAHFGLSGLLTGDSGDDEWSLTQS